MSNLPPALAARLAKRGIIPQAKVTQPEPQFEVHEEEEVIAEDYDDVSKPDLKANVPQFDVKICNTVPGCPNKYNIYHNCTGYCATKYADVPLEPSKMIRKKFERLLKKYPLTDSAWEQVYEPGLKTFYFWNTRTDQVSWLPPSHPDAKITLPAEKLRKLLRDDIFTAEEDDEGNQSLEEDDDDDGSNESNDDSSDSSEDSSSSSEEEKVEAPSAKQAKQQHQQRRQAISRVNQLDPMDPAAYSNIPRGKWSDGLRNNDD